MSRLLRGFRQASAQVRAPMAAGVRSRVVTPPARVVRRWKTGAAKAPPSGEQVRLFALSQALPFVAFGVMDNVVMLTAGDAIDGSLGMWFGLSTLTAAGFGQVFSDCAGVLFGGAIERVASRCGLRQHGVTGKQARSRYMLRVGLAAKGMGWGRRPRGWGWVGEGLVSTGYTRLPGNGGKYP